jgi:hypothetical protein
MFRMSGGASDVAARGDRRTISVNLTSGTVADVLVEAARAHGEIIWQFPWFREPRSAEAASRCYSFGFETFAGATFSTCIPYRNEQPR